MTATLHPCPPSSSARTAVDALDIEAVRKAEIASAKVIDFAGKYLGEFDDMVTIDGREMDVKVLYPNDKNEIDVFRLNADSDPVAPEIRHWLSIEDFDRLLTDAMNLFAKKEAEADEAALLARDDRKYRETLEARMCGA